MANKLFWNQDVLWTGVLLQEFYAGLRACSPVNVQPDQEECALSMG